MSSGLRIAFDYPSAHCVHYGFRLFVNLFLHEMLEAAFFYLFEVECDFLKLTLYLLILNSFNNELVLCKGNHLSILQI